MEVATPVNNGEAPFNSGEAPVNSREAPVNSREAPVNSGETPVNSRGAPVNSGEAPVNNGEAPVNSGEAPVNNGEAPVNSGEAPVDNNKANKEVEDEQVEQVEDELKITEEAMEINLTEGSSHDFQVPEPLITIPLPQAVVEHQLPRTQEDAISNSIPTSVSGNDCSNREVEDQQTVSSNSSSTIGTMQNVEGNYELNGKVEQELNFSQDQRENKVINLGKLQEHFNAMTHHVVQCEQATALARENKETLRVVHRRDGQEQDSGKMEAGQSGVMDMATECLGCGVTFIWDSLNMLNTIKMENS